MIPSYIQTLLRQYQPTGINARTRTGPITTHGTFAKAFVAAHGGLAAALRSPASSPAPTTARPNRDKAVGLIAIAKAQAVAPAGKFAVDYLLSLRGEIVAIATPGGAPQITLAAVRKRLDEIRASGAKSLVIHLDSNGGEVAQAMLIADAISAFPGHISAKAGAQCASAAVLLLLSADDRVCAADTQFLLHTAAIADGRGTAEQHRATAVAVARHDEKMMQLIIKRTGAPAAKIKMAMSLGTPFGAARAVELRLVDRIIGDGR
jgi:ATP-dependent protease ClpP protease subunit